MPPPQLRFRLSALHPTRGIATSTPLRSRRKSFPDHIPSDGLDLGPNPNPTFKSVHPVSTPGFVPRPTFDVSEDIGRSYFLGHHVSALSAMRTALARISFVIEARDYRVPLTSLNPELDRALAGRPRIIVYTKCDLVFRNMGTQDLLRRWHEEYNRAQAVVFHSDPIGGRGMSGKPMRSTKLLLDAIREVKTDNDDNPILGIRGLVVGMPNAGKSSLLNMLRGAGMKGEISSGDRGTKTVLRGGKRVTVHKKAQKTASQPGVTRKMSGPIRILPRITSTSAPLEDGREFPESVQDAGVYILDTPGVFVPYVPLAEDMVKLALVGMVKSTVVHEEIVADYLLYRLNLETPRLYKRLSEPTNNVNVWLERIAKRTGKLGKGGSYQTEAAASWIIAQWRAGELGHFMLDNVDMNSIVDVQRRMEEPPGLSIKEARKKMISQKRERANALNAEATP